MRCLVLFLLLLLSIVRAELDLPCVENNRICDDSFPCCSEGPCWKGLCRPKNCIVDEQACDEEMTCCSGYCDHDTSTCQPTSCQGPGGPCSSSIPTNCCNYLKCVSNSTATPTSQNHHPFNGTCQFKTPASWDTYNLTDIQMNTVTLRWTLIQHDVDLFWSVYLIHLNGSLLASFPAWTVTNYKFTMHNLEPGQTYEVSVQLITDPFALSSPVLILHTQTLPDFGPPLVILPAATHNLRGVGVALLIFFAFALVCFTMVWCHSKRYCCWQRPRHQQQPHTFQSLHDVEQP